MRSTPRSAPGIPPLILASTSPYRRTLLARIADDFETVVPAVDESPRPGEPPADLARRLARDKAGVVARSHPGAIVIGSDQVAVIDDRVLGKPGDMERARSQLQAGSGREVLFHTAVCVAAADGRAFEALDTTRVRFRILTAGEIDAYLEIERPFDCAGSFRCEGLGIALFEAIETHDPTALIGLPLIASCNLFRAAGLDPLRLRTAPAE